MLIFRKNFKLSKFNLKPLKIIFWISTPIKRANFNSSKNWNSKIFNQTKLGFQKNRRIVQAS